MLMLPSLMTEKSFWTSEQRLLTSNWTKQNIYFSPESRPKSLSSREEKTEIKGWRLGCLVRIRRQVGKPPLPSVLLANVQSLGNKLDDLRSRLSYQWYIKYCNILCFTESWLNDDMDNIELAGFSLHRLSRPDLREIFMSLFWVGQGVIWVLHSMF